MNYGLGGMTDSSGEINIVKEVSKRYANQSLIIFDVGAHNGEYTKNLLEYIQSPQTIHCFEPGKASFATLKIFDNNPNVFKHKIALSDKAETTDLYYNEEGTAFASLNQAKYFQYGITLDKSEKIQTTTMDEFCVREKIDKINFCKIDVEGHELSVLKGAKNLILNNKIDMIQFEFGMATTFSGTYLKDFFSLLSNYEIYRVLQDGIYRINYNERYEIFLTSNYLAINKTFAAKIKID